jgi:hypothetical protein
MQKIQIDITRYDFQCDCKGGFFYERLIPASTGQTRDPFSKFSESPGNINSVYVSNHWPKSGKDPLTTAASRPSDGIRCLCESEWHISSATPF